MTHMDSLAQQLVAAVAAVLPEAYDKACGVTHVVTPTTLPQDWTGEARAVVLAVLEWHRDLIEMIVEDLHV